MGLRCGWLAEWIGAVGLEPQRPPFPAMPGARAGQATQGKRGPWLKPQLRGGKVRQGVREQAEL